MITVAVKTKDSIIVQIFFVLFGVMGIEEAVDEISLKHLVLNIYL